MSDTETKPETPVEPETKTAALATPETTVTDRDSCAQTPDEEFQQLDPRWIGLERLTTSIAFVIVGGIALSVGTLLYWVIPFPWYLLVLAVWCVILAAAVFSLVWWPRWEYNRQSYCLGSKVFELRSGVVWQSSVAIPLSRLQHIDLHRGPLERRWGLASLQIHTAGTRDASQTIPGLDVETANVLRDQLIEAANRGSDEQDSD